MFKFLKRKYRARGFKLKSFVSVYTLYRRVLLNIFVCRKPILHRGYFPFLLKNHNSNNNNNKKPKISDRRERKPNTNKNKRAP